MIRHKILDVWVKEDNPASQEVFRWFKYSIEKDYKSIEILSESESMNSQQDVFKLTQSYLYYNSNAAIDSGKPVNAEPTTCSISIIVVCGTIIVNTI